ncbi:MAG TPA: hypothetical protein VFN41_12355 [Candidatus Limnocylindrales bacterium]|nr:hypothetical protein [Candidatus Limnocylindrales bacterium]
MSFHPEQTVGFLPLLILDVSMEHSHRRTAVVVDGTSAESEAPKSGTPRRLVGYFFTKALAPLRLAGAR